MRKHIRAMTKLTVPLQQSSTFSAVSNQPTVTNLPRCRCCWTEEIQGLPLDIMKSIMLTTATKICL